MDRGQDLAAAAAEQRRAELGLTQKQTGVDPKTWRQLVEREKWPEQVLTRSRIEAHLDLRLGALSRIARGESTLEQEILHSPGGPGGEHAPAEVAQMVALLNEASDHYRSEQPSLGDLKVQMVRDLAERILRDPDGNEAATIGS